MNSLTTAIPLTAPTPKDSTKWTLVALLSTGLAIDYLARLAIYSVFPLLQEDLIASDFVLGLVASSFPWTYGGLSPVAGYLGDRFSRRTVVIVSVIAWSFASILCGFANVSWQIVTMRVILAMAQVCYMPTANAYLADFHGTDTQAKAVGLYQAGGYFGTFLAGLPAAYVATHLSWRIMLVLCGVLGLIVAFVMWKRLPVSKTPSAHGGVKQAGLLQESVILLRKPSIVVIIVTFSLMSVIFWVLSTYLPLFIFQRYQVSIESAAFQATFYMQASTIVLMPLLGALWDACAKKRERNRFIACAIVCVLGIPALIGIGVATHPAILITSLILLGLVMAGMDTSWLPMLCTFTVSTQRAFAYGLLNAFGTVAGGCAAMITALVMKKFGLGLVMASLSALFGVITGLLLLVGFGFLKRDRVELES
ncbi:MAG: MFS transporter [Acidobacteria bacterium]|nr:MFS transporter [Acidobacteriota bacterium]MCI0720337.1 MFS transporter [Acidobacteriota bacterium]